MFISNLFYQSHLSNLLTVPPPSHQLIARTDYAWSKIAKTRNANANSKSSKPKRWPPKNTASKRRTNEGAASTSCDRARTTGNNRWTNGSERSRMRKRTEGIIYCAKIR